MFIEYIKVLDAYRFSRIHVAQTRVRSHFHTSDTSGSRTDFKLGSRSCCPSDGKVDDQDDSVRFRTDAGVKVGRGSRRANEQADRSVRVEAA